MSLISLLRKSKQLNERTTAKIAGISRSTLRNCEQNIFSAKIENLEKIANIFDYTFMLSIVPKELPNSDLSIVGISSFICRDGFDSWKIHVFDFVDFFRQAKDLRLIFLPPMSCLDGRLKALLASIVCQLCSEIGCIPPDWALQEYYLEKPWFVSEIQSLKATTILESPLAFRRNNIFVLKNFLQRA